MVHFSTTLPSNYRSLHQYFGIRFQSRVSHAMSLGVDVPILLKPFQPKSPASLSPLMLSDAAPVNLMAQCVPSCSMLLTLMIQALLLESSVDIITGT